MRLLSASFVALLVASGAPPSTAERAAVRWTKLLANLHTVRYKAARLRREAHAEVAQVAVLRTNTGGTSAGVAKPSRPTRPRSRRVASWPEQGGWRIDASGEQSIRLFEVEDPGGGAVPADLSSGAQGRRPQGPCLPGNVVPAARSRRVLLQGLSAGSLGHGRLGSLRDPIRPERGQRPDLLKLNLAVEGPGTVWLRKHRTAPDPARVVRPDGSALAT